MIIVSKVYRGHTIWSIKYFLIFWVYFHLFIFFHLVIVKYVYEVFQIKWTNVYILME